MKNFIISFDVSDDKRRRRLVKLLLNYSYRIQYSVFELVAADRTADFVKAEIKKIISAEEDSVMILEICRADWNKRLFIGRSAIEHEATIL